MFLLVNIDIIEVNCRLANWIRNDLSQENKKIGYILICKKLNQEKTVYVFLFLIKVIEPALNNIISKVKLSVQEGVILG